MGTTCDYYVLLGGDDTENIVPNQVDDLNLNPSNDIVLSGSTMSQPILKFRYSVDTPSSQ